MKFKDRIKRFNNRIGWSKKKSSGFLCLAILTPIVLNSLATVGTIKYFSTQAATESINDFVNNYTNSIGDHLLLRLDSSVAAIDVASNERPIKLFNQVLDKYLLESNFSYSPQVAVLNEDGSIIASKLRDLTNNSSVSSQDISTYLLQQSPTWFKVEQHQKISFKIEGQHFFGQVIPWKHRALGVNRLIVVIPTSELLVDSIGTQYSSISQYSTYLLSVVPLWILTAVWMTWLIKKLQQSREISLANSETKESLEHQNASQSEPTDLAANYEPYILLANMSHELRSPLNAILGFAQIMEQELSTNQAHQANLAIINRSGERLLSIINDVVDLAKVETNRLTLELNKIHFHSWLDNLEQTLNFVAREQGWKFTLNKQSNLPQGVCIDERRLRQILKSLIDYCLLESRSSTEVVLRITSNHFQSTAVTSLKNSNNKIVEKHNIVLEVENTDFPFDTTELSNLFDPLSRVSSGSNNTASSSLSLPLSQKLAQLMGGNLSVSSSSVCGTGIKFKLKIQAESTDPPKSQIEPSVRRIIGLESNQQKYRILIVDDSKLNRTIMSKLLEPVGFEVEEAVNGQEAVDIWFRWQPHLIWMDLRMPIMNGYEATERIKSSAQTWHTPIVALSASSLEEDKLRFKAAGCDDFVGKPCPENVIFDKIAQHLGIRYVYEAIDSSSQNEIEFNFESNLKITADRLEIMPNQWLNQLEQAASMLDRGSVTQLLQQIPVEHASLKNALQKQVDNFDFEEIRSLAKSSRKID